MGQATEDTRKLPTVTMHTLILVLTIILSLTGNSLLCLAFCRNRRLRTITNFYVFSLAVSDIIMATFGYPFSAVASGLRKWQLGFKFCQFNGFLSYLWAVMSVRILALTAVNRYYCIVKPRFYVTRFTAKKTFFSILIMWLFSFTVGLTVFLNASVEFKWHPHYLFCQVTMPDFPASKVINFAFVTGFTALPLGIIFYCYGRVYRAIRRHNAAVVPSLQDANNQGTLSAREIQTSRVLLAAVTAFCVCWIPSTLALVLEQFSEIPPFWQSFFTFSASCSSWSNPVIYGVMNRAMRKECMKLLGYQKET